MIFHCSYNSCWLIFYALITLVGCGQVSVPSTDTDNGAEIVISLPQYWQDYIDERREKFINANNEIKDSGVSFLFITDIHVATNNMMSPLLIKYLIGSHYINKVVCGGDIISGFHKQKNDALNELSTWVNALSIKHVVTLLGNHDLNSNDQMDSAQELEESDFYNYVCHKASSDVRYVNGRLYGYEDDHNQKVRFIYLNTKAPDSSVIDNYQLAWMQERILELQSGWTVVVFCHQFWTGDLSIRSALQLDTNGILIQNAINEIYDNSDAIISCIISGHCHRNYAAISAKGYPIIATTCDTGGFLSEDYDPDTPFRVAGTSTEQAFDLFYINTASRNIRIIRFGAGDSIMDRCFDY